MKPTITVTGQRKLTAQMRKKGISISNQTLDALNGVALLILAQAKRNLKNNGSIATGGLRDTGVVKKMQDGSEVDFVKQYASNVEFGQKVGTTVNPKELEGWVMKKGLADSFTASGNRRGRGQSFAQKVKSIAFLIARKIKQHGTKPRPYLYPAVRQYEKQVITILKKEVKV